MGAEELEVLLDIVQSGGGTMGSVVLLFIGYKYVPKLFAGGSKENAEKNDVKLAIMEHEKSCKIHEKLDKLCDKIENAKGKESAELLNRIVENTNRLKELGAYLREKSIIIDKKREAI